MTVLPPASPLELLRYFHERLGTQFAILRDDRAASSDQHSPIYAIEHDLDAPNLELLGTAVRAAVHEGLRPHHRILWLPFVVYAAESGYEYVGDEYWQTFERNTPGWDDGKRPWIKAWFERFATEYDGAVPTGSFAQVFKIIAWPITHAVLPRYLQRQLAHLLFEFSGALTAELLEDPDELGIRLERRASHYTERFRIFCANTQLMGRVAAALLSGENEPTPYLSSAALARIVDGLSSEQLSRHWLRSARQSATRVRGFLPSPKASPLNAASGRSPRSAEPRVVLRREQSWLAYAALPDLTEISGGTGEFYEELRSSRATVNGGARSVPPSGLLYPGQEVRLIRWPRPDQPFLQLDRGSQRTNRVLADNCNISSGPRWLFRRQTSGLALEVRGKTVRAGQTYVLITTDGHGAPGVPWCTEAPFDVVGAKAYELVIPPRISEMEQEEMISAGLVVTSQVSIRPAALVASAWDGEGEAEWLAGEPAVLGIRSELLPDKCRISLNEIVFFLDWPNGEPELLFNVAGLPVGRHELTVAIVGREDRTIADGKLTITIRDPRTRTEGGSAGEGIRIFASPARPTLSDLWDERAVVNIHGPASTDADLRVSFLGLRGEVLTEVRRTIQLPLDEDEWHSVVSSIRNDHRFGESYDVAEGSKLTVERAGIGFASLTSERGFQPLRWRFERSRDGNAVATLVDRTDGGTTTLQFYDVGSPLTGTPKDPAQPFEVPAQGGLAIASTGETVAAAILPTNPNALLHLPRIRPAISLQPVSAREVLRLAQGHRRWLNADLPADVFAVNQLRIVGDAIARAISALMSGHRWSGLERRLVDAEDPIDFLDAMQAAVGTSKDQQILASMVARSLFKWSNPEDLLSGFHDAITPHLASAGLQGRPSAPRLLLMLAGRPGFVTDWEPDQSTFIIERVLESPFLYRAARFAVLGTRALNDDTGAERGF